jgi:glycosyltransferase involved in cell wall biosynthesis
LDGASVKKADELPRISIGLPTYNRPELLALVLENFRNQTFADFELIISDNASPDPRVGRLCEELAVNDLRFRYIRQPANQGAAANFWYVYDRARAPLFLWASDDDSWPLDFLERGIAALDANPDASAWFCQVVNVNTSGDLVRKYPSFSRYHSSRFKFIDLTRFLWEPEIMGKANLIYSIFRREALRATIGQMRSRPLFWGADMALVYGYLCRFDLLIDDQLTLKKRVLAENREKTLHPRSQIYPWEERRAYFRGYRRAAAGSGYVVFTAAVLVARFAYDYWFNRRAQHDYENWPLRREFENWRIRWRHRLGVSLRWIKKTISGL